ncbi:MAG TPA: hypothetical protein VH331_10170 [Allosphingosinicella sp.]|jgi:hypothetical protein|nr:hypothetical protein [Allosphingosinicella sp.]
MVAVALNAAHAAARPAARKIRVIGFQFLCGWLIPRCAARIPIAPDSLAARFPFEPRQSPLSLFYLVSRAAFAGALLRPVVQRSGLTGRWLKVPAGSTRCTAASDESCGVGDTSKKKATLAGTFWKIGLFSAPEAAQPPVRGIA